MLAQCLQENLERMNLYLLSLSLLEDARLEHARSKRNALSSAFLDEKRSLEGSPMQRGYNCKRHNGKQQP